ncbi:MAG: P1 family peptidase [Blastocatellia bacterium]|nr:P1 family peptidase [Blastocatellia bacterium]
MRLNILLPLLCLLLTIIPSRAQQAVNAPVPKTDKSGPSLKFDFPAMLVGVAEYDEGPTGTTVFYFPGGFKGAVDLRGGAPGQINAASLQLGYERKMMQAVVFSGGSWYGLSAATGVANGLKELKAAEGNTDFIAGVVGAIIFDVGGRRFSRVTPDDTLGKAALRSVQPGWFPLGARGAGRFAMQGVYFNRGDGADNYVDWSHSGQGGAFRTVGPTKIGVFTVVNSLGSVVDRDGRVVRCGRNDSDRPCPKIAEKLKTYGPISAPFDDKGGPSPNTTITLVVTNQKLPFSELQRLAVQVHSSMARAIQPLATGADGDILYAVTTDDVENPALTATDLGVIASEVAWDAVLSSVPELTARPAALSNQPNEKDLLKYAGTYVFPGRGELTVSVASGGLSARFKGNGRIYFDAGKDYRLTASAGETFILESKAREVLKFDDSAGRITGLTMNPGPWAVRAVSADSGRKQ